MFFEPFAIGQNDSISKQKPEISITGFIDVFYAYDFDEPKSNIIQPFFYNHNRHNEFNLNLGLIKFGIKHSKYRSNLAFHSGTYVNDNYASEPSVAKYISEASVGLSLNKKNNLWIDAGILEGRLLKSQEDILKRGNKFTDTDFFLTSSIAISF